MVDFSDVASLLFSSSRSISGGSTTIIPDLAIRERHRDSLGITAHPIQTGAAITDHAFVMQPEFTLELGWSNSSYSATVANFSGTSVSDLLTGDFGEQYVKQVYDKVLTLQKSRQLCTVVTGKRRYTNVLIESVETYTDASTAYSMMVSMNCRALQLVSVATVTNTTVTASTQATPASTSPLQTNGTQQLQSTQPTSALKSLASSITGIL